MATLDASDLLTLRYASNLPLLLAAPSPALSSHLAQTRPGSPSSSSSSRTTATRCGYCGAETIGGLAGAAYWIERGELVGSCGACRRISVRRHHHLLLPSTPPSSSSDHGKRQFERVKKRSRTAAPPLPHREVLHPTAYRTTTISVARAINEEDADTFSRPRSPSTRESATSSAADTAKREPTSRDSTAPPPLPSISLDARYPPTKKKKKLLPSTTTTSQQREEHVVPRSAPSASSRSSLAAAAAPLAVREPVKPDVKTTTTTKAPVSLDKVTAPQAPPPTTTTTTTKRNKRPKNQPAGLANLLAQKKKEREAQEQAGVAGGLMDFLQAL